VGSLLYKNDWDEAKSIFEDWWNRDLDRPLIQVFAPKNDGDVEFDSWAFLRHHPNVETALSKLLGRFSRTIFEKEAYPNVWVNLGPGSLSAYLGAELRFDARAETAWFQGNFSSSQVEEARLDPESKWWRYTIECTEAAARRCKDKAVVAFTDLLDIVTVLGQLIGNYPTNLMKDMFLNEKKLVRASDNVHKIWFQCYDELCKIINVEENGYSTWAGLWSKRKHLVLQCDTIVYLSPKLFERFAYPYIIEECEHFERTIWHLDGPLELPHLDQLLDIPELDAIQWIPGEGNLDGGDDCWLPLYRKIQEKGKMLQLFVPPEKVMHLLDKILPKGVAVAVSCRTSGEAAALIKEFESRYG